VRNPAFKTMSEIRPAPVCFFQTRLCEKNFIAIVTPLLSIGLSLTSVNVDDSQTQEAMSPG